MSVESGNQQVKERVIYLLLSPNDKKFYIGHCLKEALRETYQKNSLGVRKSTEELIELIKPERPCLFTLETFTGTVREATTHIVVWAKIFLENGYECYNSQSLIEMTDHLYIDTEDLYEARRGLDVRELTSCSRCAMPRYRSETCEKYPLEVVMEEQKKAKRPKEIRIMVSNEEYENIQRLAKKCSMPVSAYIRLVAENPIIIRYNYDTVREHTKRITEVRDAINRVAFTIEATNNYLPRDIETIVDLMTGLFESENQLLKSHRECREKNILAYENERLSIETPT